jgi:hypothetical protein
MLENLKSYIDISVTQELNELQEISPTGLRAAWKQFSGEDIPEPGLLKQRLKNWMLEVGLKALRENVIKNIPESEVNVEKLKNYRARWANDSKVLQQNIEKSWQEIQEQIKNGTLKPQ